MATLTLKAAIGSVLLAGAMLWACTTPEEVHFGGPNALSPDKAPPPPPGSSTDGGSSGGDADPLACTPVDGGACAVKWSTDIVPLMTETGAWGCGKSGSCHGGAATPPINANDPKQAYTQLRTWVGTAKGGVRAAYINPCSIDPNQSRFVCNVSPAPDTCGSLMPKGASVLPADLDKLKQWVACGAPNN